ncbi:MAG TPA: LytR C-terminal domain-containing protein, partial [Acidimicrobiales bacterium]|nr:LytR C-terminal domain-containing protein [Acidimicrobiales bacterium]
LEALGYHVTASSGSWPPVGPLSETVVEYSPGHVADAERVAASLRGIVSLAESPTVAPQGSDLPSSLTTDVTIVTGTNFSVVAPSTGSPGGATGGSTGTGSTSGSTGTTSLLGAVSSPSDPAPPYDPRPCTS